MIKILPIITGDYIDGPSRKLTQEETESITSYGGFDGTHYIWYEGDEPVATIDIESVKRDLTDQLDANTRSVIAQGFTFQDKIFSLSTENQANLNAMKQADESRFPISFITKDDKDYLPVSFAQRDAFYYAAFDYVRNIREGNGQKKFMLSACETLQDLRAMAEQFSLVMPE